MPLSITLAEIKRYVGRQIGANRDPGKWSPAQIQDVNDAIASGLRDFYYLRRFGGEEYHVWSFMSRNLQVSIPTGVTVIDLPEDFSRLQGGLTYGAGTENLPLGIVDEREIRAMLSKDSSTTGAPLYGAVRFSESGQYELIVYPKTDASYSLTGRYLLDPSAPEEDADAPLGGSLHAETIMEACLAAAEKLVNPEAGEGVHHAAFERLLQTSVAADKSLVDTQESATWPTADGRDTDDLDVTKRYLQRLVGRSRGFGPNPDTWTHGRTSEVAEALRQGLRNFYNPPALPGEKYPHQWSFLRPVRRLDLIANKNEYDLPEDFASMEGPITFVPGDNLIFTPIEQYGEAELRKWLQQQTASSRPWRYATTLIDPHDGARTRYKIIFAPIPDTAYSVHYRYRINPYGLGEDAALPLGNQPHAQTVIESCLAAADELSGQDRGHKDRFMECLWASVGHDREVEAPDNLGYVGDGSDRKDTFGRDQVWNHHWYDENVVTYEGTEY